MRKPFLSLLQKSAQSAVEYLLLFTVVALVVIGALGVYNSTTGQTSGLMGKAYNSTKDYYSTVTNVIMGDDPIPIDGGWCQWGECIGGYERRECMCPQPAFGGKFCEADGSGTYNDEAAKGIRQCSGECVWQGSECSEECDKIGTRTWTCSCGAGKCAGTVPGESYGCLRNPPCQCNPESLKANWVPCPNTGQELSSITNYEEPPLSSFDECGTGLGVCQAVECPGDTVPKKDLSGCTLCGNGIREAEEQCDETADGFVFGCADCRCDPVSYNPLPGGGCELRCGNGKLESGEECEWGLGCDGDCQCKKGYSPTPDGSCEITCGNGEIDEGEQCDYSGAQTKTDAGFTYKYTCTADCQVMREVTCPVILRGTYYDGDEGFIQTNNCTGKTGASVMPGDFSCDDGWTNYDDTSGASMADVESAEPTYSETNNADRVCEFRCDEPYQFNGEECVCIAPVEFAGNVDTFKSKVNSDYGVTITMPARPNDGNNLSCRKVDLDKACQLALGNEGAHSYGAETSSWDSCGDNSKILWTGSAWEWQNGCTNANGSGGNCKTNKFSCTTCPTNSTCTDPKACVNTFKCIAPYIDNGMGGCTLCGNGSVESSEDCDGGAGCLDTCYCPEGYISDGSKGCTLCGNGKVDSGENCGNCPSDVKCSDSEECVSNTCEPLCGNGRIDPGENCNTCSGPETQCPSDKICTDSGTCGCEADHRYIEGEGCVNVCSPGAEYEWINHPCLGWIEQCQESKSLGYSFSKESWVWFEDLYNSTGGFRKSGWYWRWAAQGETLPEGEKGKWEYYSCASCEGVTCSDKCIGPIRQAGGSCVINSGEEVCEYSVLETCEYGCSGYGVCDSDPCDGVTCPDQCAPSGTALNVSGECVEGSCSYSTTNCSAGEICDPNTVSCVGCLANIHCEGGLVCNTSTNTCVGCVNNSDCSSGESCNAEGVCEVVCGDGKVGSGENCGNCPSDVKCSDSEECVSNACEPLCGNGRIDPGENCKTCSGPETQCPSDKICTDGVCDSDPCDGVTCPDQCAPSGTALNVSGECVEGSCSYSTTNCSAGEICDPSTVSCVGCLANTDCEGGLVCNTSTNTCVECTNGNQCKGGYCSFNQCVECTQIYQCKHDQSRSLVRCEYGDSDKDNRCVPCQEGYRNCVRDGLGETSSCETDINNNPKHCGRCDNKCKGSESCIKGTCEAPDPGLPGVPDQKDRMNG